MEKEIWKDVIGYEGKYQVSNIGRIKGLERAVESRPGTYYTVPEKIKTLIEKKEKNKKQGYLVVNLYKNNNGKSLYVHRLVAEAFIPNTKNKKTVNHINGDKHDNRVENLEWMTYAENNAHAVENGLNDYIHKRNHKGSVKVAQYDKDMNLIQIFPSMREAERQTGIDATAIGRGIRKGWHYGGYIWKYA